MAMTWFRLYADMLHDRKVLKLNDYHFRVWVNALLIACQEREGKPKDETGRMGTVEDVALDLREDDVEKISAALAKLIDLDLLKEKDGIYYIVQWRKRQYLDPEAERKRQAYEKTKEKRPKSLRKVSADSPKSLRRFSEKSPKSLREISAPDTEQIQNRINKEEEQKNFVSQSEKKEDKKPNIHTLMDTTAGSFDMPSSDLTSTEVEERKRLLKQQAQQLEKEN